MQAARDFLADPRRPDGTPYDDGVVARVRKDMFREHESQDEDAVLTRERFIQYRELRLATIAAQREELLAARAAGTYDSAQLGDALDLLDAEQIAVEMRKGKLPIRPMTTRTVNLTRCDGLRTAPSRLARLPQRA